MSNNFATSRTAWGFGIPAIIVGLILMLLTYGTATFDTVTLGTAIMTGLISAGHILRRGIVKAALIIKGIEPR